MNVLELAKGRVVMIVQEAAKKAVQQVVKQLAKVVVQQHALPHVQENVKAHVQELAIVVVAEVARVLVQAIVVMAVVEVVHHVPRPVQIHAKHKHLRGALTVHQSAAGHAIPLVKQDAEDNVIGPAVARVTNNVRVLV